MITYQPGYPRQMVHPQHAPSVINGDALGISGTPLRFPPVLAQTPDDEGLLRSQGYRAAGEAQTVTDYQEYPLMLSHPDHVDAVPETKDAINENGVMKIFVVPGHPEKYPPVTVKNAEEERAWEAKGYHRPGRGDSKAFDHAKHAPGTPGAEWPKWVDGVLMEDPDTPAKGPQQYPMWITLGNGQQVVASSRADHERLCGPLDDGPAKPVPTAPDADEWAAFQAWKASQVSQAPEVTEAPETDERAVLMAELDEAGIAYDKRWGVPRMKRALESRAA